MSHAILLRTLAAVGLLIGLPSAVGGCTFAGFTSEQQEPTKEIVLGFGRDVCPVGCYPVIRDKLWHYPGVYRVDVRPRERRAIVIAREDVDPQALVRLVSSEGSAEILSVKR